MTTVRAGRYRWALALVLLFAFGLRLYGLGEQSLWYDETVSAHLAGKSPPALVAHTAGDIHPPGYYLLLHAWTRLAGDSDFAIAFPSLMFGVILVALAYALGARLFGTRAGLLAAFLVAISPYNVWYSQEVRMYTLGAALGTVLLGVVIRLLTVEPTPGQQESGRWRGDWLWFAVYALCGALGLWTLYYFAFLLLAINLLVGLWWVAAGRRRRAGWGWLGRWALAQVVVLVLYAPWIPVAWRQATEPPVPPWRGFTALGQVLVETWSALCLGQSVEPAQVWPVLLLFAVLFALGLLARPGRSRAWLLAGHVFLPVLLIYLASLVTPLYHVRYAFTISTPFYILIGAGLAALARPVGARLRQAWGRPLAALSLAVVVVASGISIYRYHTDPRYASDDHRAAVRFLAERWRPGDAVLVNAGYAYPALVTYWDDVASGVGAGIGWRGRLTDYCDAEAIHGSPAAQGAVVLQSGTVDGDPSLGWGDPDSDFYATTRAETEAALACLFADFDRVWVYRIYDTVTDPDGAIRAWLQAHGAPFEDQVFTGESQLRVQGFLTGRDPRAGAVATLDEGLADGSLRLVASTPLPSSVEVGGPLDVALVWEVGNPSPASDALLFAGLFDGAGGRWAQSDERPLGSLYPVADWPAGALVRTPLRVPVPPGTPPGRYRLEVGWYRFVDGQPVWLPWTTGERLALGEVDVVAPGDWDALPLPEAAYSTGVTVGGGVRLLGFDARALEALPGEAVRLDLYWQASEDAPEPGLAVLQLADDAGRVWAEAQAAPAGGRAPFGGLAAGQVVRDPWAATLPGDLAPGVYNLSVGRRQGDGSWLPVRRGPFPLGDTYPLATVRATGRSLDLQPPAVQHPVNARFGESVLLVGYDRQPPATILTARTPRLELTLYWQALAPMDRRHKVFVHLTGEGGPADIRAQADVYPHLPTTAWVPGEYLRDGVTLDLPAGLAPGPYWLRLGLYDEATGARLPVTGESGEPLGDHILLEEIRAGE